MFDGPEYEPYIRLCRELRFERKWQVGDYVSVTEHGTFACGIVAGSDRPTGNGDPVWLPRLDQLLAMLEEVGVAEIAFEQYPDAPHEPWACCPVREVDVGVHMIYALSEFTFLGFTREEAAARLWCAVTAHPSSRA